MAGHDHPAQPSDGGGVEVCKQRHLPGQVSPAQGQVQPRPDLFARDARIQCPGQGLMQLRPDQALGQQIVHFQPLQAQRDPADELAFELFGIAGILQLQRIQRLLDRLDPQLDKFMQQISHPAPVNAADPGVYKLVQSLQHQPLGQKEFEPIRRQHRQRARDPGATVEPDRQPEPTAKAQPPAIGRAIARPPAGARGLQHPVRQGRTCSYILADIRAPS